MIDNIGAAKELANAPMASKGNAMLNQIVGAEMECDSGLRVFSWPIGKQWWRQFLTWEELFGNRRS